MILMRVCLSSDQTQPNESVNSIIIKPLCLPGLETSLIPHWARLMSLSTSPISPYQMGCNLQRIVSEKLPLLVPCCLLLSSCSEACSLAAACCSSTLEEGSTWTCLDRPGSARQRTRVDAHWWGNQRPLTGGRLSPVVHTQLRVYSYRPAQSSLKPIVWV